MRSLSATIWGRAITPVGRRLQQEEIMNDRDEYIAFRMGEGASYEEAAAEYDESCQAEIDSERAAEQAAEYWFAFPGDRPNAGFDDPRSY